MTNAKIAATFDLVADLLEFQGANAFRVRAYRNAARTIRDLSESIAAIVADDQRDLTDIDGIGKDLAQKCATLVETGELPMLIELQKEVPESVLAILRIPGLGPKKAAALFDQLGISSLDELQTACRQHKVRELKGFGPKTEETILAGIELAATADDRMRWADADVIVQAVLAHLRKSPAVTQVEAAGSYRRGKETVGDLDFLAVAVDAAQVMDHFGAFEGVADTIARGETHTPSSSDCRIGARATSRILNPGCARRCRAPEP